MFLARGSCPDGTVLTLYPGLVHDSRDVEEQAAASALADEAFAPAPPAWTVDNHYLLALRCMGRSFLVDGQPWGLSARRWRRAAAGLPVPSNDAWLQASGAPWLPTAAAEAAAGERSGLETGPQQQAAEGRPVKEALLQQASLGARTAAAAHACCQPSSNLHGEDAPRGTPRPSAGWSRARPA